MNCLVCGVKNEERVWQCFSCGASLYPALALSMLAATDASVSNGDYALATANLTAADRFIIDSPPEQRKRYHLTARAFRLQGIIYYNKGDMDVARKELSSAVRELEGEDSSNGNDELLADVLNRLGNIEHYSAHLDIADSYFTRSLEVAVRAGAYHIATKAINNTGNLYVSRGEIDKAAECYTRGLTYAEKAGPATLAQAYTLLAWLHSNYGPFQLALSYADKAVSLGDQVTTLDNRSLIYNQAGTVYLKYGILEIAEKYLREAYRLAHRARNQIVEVQVLAQLAELLRHYDDSEAWHSYVIKAFGASTNSAYLRKESALQVVTYYIGKQDIGRAQRALRTMRESLEKAETQDKREIAVVARAEAVVEAAQLNWRAAEQQFLLALNSGTLTDYEMAQVWQDYALMLYQQDGENPNQRVYARAFEAAERAVSILQRLGLAHRIISLQAYRMAQNRPAAGNGGATASQLEDREAR